MASGRAGTVFRVDTTGVTLESMIFRVCAAEVSRMSISFAVPGSQSSGPASQSETVVAVDIVTGVHHLLFFVSPKRYVVPAGTETESVCACFSAGMTVNHV